MSALEMLQLRERACWNTYLITQSAEDLRVWRSALQSLNDELEHRTRLLAEAVHPHVQTSGEEPSRAE